MPASASTKVSAMVATGRGIELGVCVTRTPARVIAADIDGVVADAMAGDDTEAAIRPRDGSRRHPRNVDVERIVLRRMVGSDLGHHRREVVPIDRFGTVENCKGSAAEGGLAARVQDVAGETHAEGFRHGDQSFGRCASRSTCRPCASAPWSISESIPYASRRNPLAA